MCTIFNLRLFAMLALGAKLLTALYCFGAGFYFTSSRSLLQGFGLSFKAFGSLLLIMSCLSISVVIPNRYAMKRHNRFILLICTAVDIFVATQLLVVSAGVGSYTTPVFPKSLQLDCLLTTPLYHTTSQCTKYFRSDKVAGYRLFWMGFYSNLNDKQQLQVLYQLESTPCCGFFAPLNCIDDTRIFPSRFLTTGVSNELLVDRVTCGPVTSYYPQQSDCIDYSDPNAQPPVVGGCIYDHGLGPCLVNAQYTYAYGCASAVEDYLIASINPHVYLILIAMFFTLLSALMSCCMYLKRKETDVFPELYGKVHVSLILFVRRAVAPRERSRRSSAKLLIIFSVTASYFLPSPS